MLHPHMDELERPTSLYVSGLGPGDRFRIEVKVSQKWLEFSVNSSIISHIPIISPLYPHDSISLIHIIILHLDQKIHPDIDVFIMCLYVFITV